MRFLFLVSGPILAHGDGTLIVLAPGERPPEPPDGLGAPRPRRVALGLSVGAKPPGAAVAGRLSGEPVLSATPDTMTCPLDRGRNHPESRALWLIVSLCAGRASTTSKTCRSTCPGTR